MLPINLTLIKYGVAAALVAAMLGYVYKTAYSHGELAAQQACAEETDILIKQIHDRITKVEQNLDRIADMAIDQQEKMSKDIDEILKKIKKKPVVIVKNGKCVPSTEFIQGLNEAIRRANQK